MSEIASVDAALIRFRDRAFWKELAPWLALEDRASFSGLQPWKAQFADEAALQALLDREGYIHMAGLQDGDRVAKLSSGIAALVSAGIPPVFAMVFDDFWLPAYSLRDILRAAFGAEYVMLPDFWIWHVDPAKSERGWKPHREKGHKALFPDGRPKSLSVWLALTQATPLNGCMYIVPADRDPTYGTERDSENQFELPEVRALPAEAGDVFIWNQALMHWGAHASPRASLPRMSMAFEFMHGDVEPYNTPAIPPMTILRFEDRLKLVGMQILQYRHMYRLSPDLEAAARALVAG
ncbi:MAG TPA: phytanoyl-CoA dioxygenase family protein [Alphaproteobacteria bacterium]|jgi:hypothetical protein|nr:phytanoyl-CoA dioxygenase family protein [Alphaproteobacteria bacterium]